MKLYQYNKRQIKQAIEKRKETKTMTICYYDVELGVISVNVDFYEIKFRNGKAYFSSNYEEYYIDINKIIEIVRY